jgi:hypothetical protein
MHVRFVTPLVHPASGVECGFFRAAEYLAENTVQPWLRYELDAQFDWFGENLPIPDRIARHFKRRRTKWGVCWFNPSFKEAIARAHYCAWLFNEVGIPVRMITANRIEHIIWRDGCQIVALPSPRMPRAFA